MSIYAIKTWFALSEPRAKASIKNLNSYSFFCRSITHSVTLSEIIPLSRSG